MNIDDIKKCVSTDFMYQGGASFETHVAVLKKGIVFKFIPSIKYALYTIMYLVLSIGAFYLGKRLFFINNGLSVIGFLLLGASLVFIVAFLYFIKDYLKSIVFNKKKETYFKGYFALQILGEITTEQLAPFNSYELNLVLKNTERLHVIDHADIKSLIEDVERLSEFLNVPIWTTKSDKN